VVLLGRGKRHTIGHYPTISLSEARSAAKRILAERELGRLDPQRIAWQDAVAEYLKDCEHRVRPRTLKNYRDYLAFLKFGRRSLSDVTAREVILTLRPLSPSQREHAHRIAKTFFSWCVRHSLLDRAPNTPPVPTGKSRTRVLSEDELRAIYTTARAGKTSFHAFVSLLLLTGARRGEMSKLEWSWCNLEGSNSNFSGNCLRLPPAATKNGREHIIPIGPEATAILASLPRYTSPYVFPALRQRSDRTTVINGWSKAKAKFDKECGITDWTLHDLRRTFATNLQRLGVRLEVTEALLNHVSGTRSGIVGVYQQHQWADEKREAIQRFEAYLTNL
jgi:integrase